MYIKSALYVLMAFALAGCEPPQATSLDSHAQTVLQLNLENKDKWQAGQVLGCEIVRSGAGRCRYRVTSNGAVNRLTRCYAEPQPNIWVKQGCTGLFPDDPAGHGVHLRL